MPTEGGLELVADPHDSTGSRIGGPGAMTHRLDRQHVLIPSATTLVAFALMDPGL